MRVDPNGLGSGSLLPKLEVPLLEVSYLVVIASDLTKDIAGEGLLRGVSFRLDEALRLAELSLPFSIFLLFRSPSPTKRKTDW